MYFVFCIFRIFVLRTPSKIFLINTLKWTQTHFNSNLTVFENVIPFQRLCSYTSSQAIFSTIHIHTVGGRVFPPQRLRAEGGSGSQLVERQRQRHTNRAKANWGVQHWTLNNSARSPAVELGRGGSRCWLTACFGCCSLCLEIFGILSCATCWATVLVLRVCCVCVWY